MIFKEVKKKKKIFKLLMSPYPPPPTPGPFNAISFYYLTLTSFQLDRRKGWQRHRLEDGREHGYLRRLSSAPNSSKFGILCSSALGLHLL